MGVFGVRLGVRWGGTELILRSARGTLGGYDFDFGKSQEALGGTEGHSVIARGVDRYCFSSAKCVLLTDL